MDGPSLYYSFINHGKGVLIIDLKNDHDKSIFINMLKQADVLAGTFRPGTMEKLGFKWKRFKKSTRASYMLHRQVSDIPVR
ncbi:CoA transferase [Escherichia coli]